MKKTDAIFAAICGLSVAWLAVDFAPLLNGAPRRMTGWILLLLFILLPLLSILGLWISEKLSKKYLFLHQAGKFFLVGSFADVSDIKFYQILFFMFPAPLAVKTITFLLATFIKYWVNKFWAFSPRHCEEPADVLAASRRLDDEAISQFIYFFAVTLIGLAINVGSFWHFAKILGPQFGASEKIWQELSIIFAALAAAIWNFLGYKFLVFKK